MRGAKLAVLVAIAAALLAAGCGDDDDDSTTSSSTTTGTVGGVSLDRWIVQADQICAEGDKAQQEAAEQQFGDQPPTDAELEDFADTVVVPNLQSQHDAIAALPKPEAEAGEIDELLAKLQEGIDAVSDDPSLLIQGGDSVPAIQEASTRAQDLGLTDCGS